VTATPCEDVVRGNLCHYPAGVSQQFPADRLLVDWGIESYLGVPLCDARGRHLGHLAVLGERPMPAEPHKLFTFRIFAARAAAELERLHYEERLRESEQRWRGLTEALPQLVWSATPDGACDYFSTQWTEHTGVPETDLLGWRWLATLHPDDREPTRRLWTDSVAGRGPYDVEYRVRRSDGVYPHFPHPCIRWSPAFRCGPVGDPFLLHDSTRRRPRRVVFLGFFRHGLPLDLLAIISLPLRAGLPACPVTPFPAEALWRTPGTDLPSPTRRWPSVPWP
jgi:PAS domain S-box-containing protein